MSSSWVSEDQMNLESRQEKGIFFQTERRAAAANSSMFRRFKQVTLFRMCQVHVRHM